jgi:sec-independent protein translocase protein TatA
MAKGIKSFKKGMSDDEAEGAKTADGKTVEHRPDETVQAAKERASKS